LTLFSAVHRLLRRIIMQLSLPFLENPPRDPKVWEDLDEGHRAAIVDKLAQLIAKTETGKEEPSHE